jgi:hypothetical protein
MVFRILISDLHGGEGPGHFTPAERTLGMH